MRNLKTQKPQWRLTTNILFVEPIHTELEKAVDNYFKFNVNSGILESMMWDALKAVLRGKIIALTVAYRKEKTKHCEELLRNIEHLESIHKQTCNPKVYRKLLEECKNWKS